MTRTIRNFSPQLGLTAAAILAFGTLALVASDSRPVISRWLATNDTVPLSSLHSSGAATLDTLDVSIETASGKHTSISSTSGRVRVATMFYAHCSTLCPLAVLDIQRIEAGLTAPERARLGVLLLSLDPSRDTPQAMSAFSAERRIDSKRWVLARTSETNVSRVASVLGMSHAAASADLANHAPVLVHLDAQGRELARNEQVGAVSTRFMTAVHQAIAKDARA